MAPRATNPSPGIGRADSLGGGSRGWPKNGQEVWAESHIPARFSPRFPTVSPRRSATGVAVGLSYQAGQSLEDRMDSGTEAIPMPGSVRLGRPRNRCESLSVIAGPCNHHALILCINAEVLSGPID